LIEQKASREERIGMGYRAYIFVLFCVGNQVEVIGWLKTWANRADI